ncbi:MAG: acyl carrier protein [Planctomycetaceae bacterium]|nr:acyl carrier protein [Planctomycetaceae bacterium]
MDQATFLGHMEESLRAKPGSIQMAHRFHDLDGWDSIGALSVIAVIDERYGVTMDAGELLSCRTVGELAGLVERNLRKAA